MGNPAVNGVFPPSVTQDSFEYTSQRSTFIQNVSGKVSLNVTFISPLTPTDLKRQSVIGTYLDVSVVSIDGATHSVDLYADTSAGKKFWSLVIVKANNCAQNGSRFARLTLHNGSMICLLPFLI